MAKILSVYNRLQAGDYENGNGGKRRVSTYSVYPRNKRFNISSSSSGGGSSSVSSSSSRSGKLFQTEIILFVKLNLRLSNCIRKLIYAESMTS